MYKIAKGDVKMLKQTKMELIDSELSNFCFNKNSQSFIFLEEAIYSVSLDKYSICSPFRNTIYTDIARKYDTTSFNVENSMSKLITRMSYNTDSQIISNYFHVGVLQKVSLKAFILGVSKNVYYKSKQIKK